MPSSDIMLEGLTLMVFGMGFVFTFLTLLVFATKIMSAAAMWISPVEEVIIAPAVPMAPATQSVANDPQLMAVLAAAVKRHRQDR